MNGHRHIENEEREIQIAEGEKFNENFGRFAPHFTEADLAAKRECDRILDEQERRSETG